jgi:hypothetical protein
MFSVSHHLHHLHHNHNQPPRRLRFPSPHDPFVDRYVRSLRSRPSSAWRPAPLATRSIATSSTMLPPPRRGVKPPTPWIRWNLDPRSRGIDTSYPGTAPKHPKPGTRSQRSRGIDTSYPGTDQASRTPTKDTATRGQINRNPRHHNEEPSHSPKPARRNPEPNPKALAASSKALAASSKAPEPSSKALAASSKALAA